MALQNLQNADVSAWITSKNYIAQYRRWQAYNERALFGSKPNANLLYLLMRNLLQLITSTSNCNRSTVMILLQNFGSLLWQNCRYLFHCFFNKPRALTSQKTYQPYTSNNEVSASEDGVFTENNFYQKVKLPTPLPDTANFQSGTGKPILNVLC